jgi:two-component system sensor histidine kinase PilS (NtrC family)
MLLAAVLLALHAALYFSTPGGVVWLPLLALAYLGATVAARFALEPRRMGQTFDRHWLFVIGVDVLVFSLLHLLHGGIINYTPLYTLPVLQAAVLGPLTLAMGTAAGVTLLLLVQSGWQTLRGLSEGGPLFFQAALTGAGSFALAFLAHQLAARLAQEQQRARRSQDAMRLQQQVNELVIESISDGILVVDVRGTVHAANPAARRMLQREQRPLKAPTFSLAEEPGWQELAQLAFDTFSGHTSSGDTDVAIEHLGQGRRPLRVRTRLTTARWGETEMLCVMFLQDLREMQARLRTEKLASMGRMSAAVAHEIRNPLAAIVQANALLEEDLAEPRLKRLTAMIGQNAQRLDKIIDDVLNIARVGEGAITFTPQPLDLNAQVRRICHEWAQQMPQAPALTLWLDTQPAWVSFDVEHLRRVLVNLLDNACRYASRAPESIQVITQRNAAGAAQLAVWSDGAPMERTVEQHLFEPFFSSESRSSGLGLYICRELCDGHGASIAYQRTRRMARATLAEGNEFVITLLAAPAAETTGTPLQPPLS